MGNWSYITYTSGLYFPLPTTGRGLTLFTLDGLVVGLTNRGKPGGVSDKIIKIMGSLPKSGWKPLLTI